MRFTTLLNNTHNKSALEYSDVKITNIYVDDEPQVGNFPQHKDSHLLCNFMQLCSGSDWPTVISSATCTVSKRNYFTGYGILLHKLPVVAMKQWKDNEECRASVVINEKVMMNQGYAALINALILYTVK